MARDSLLHDPKQRRMLLGAGTSWLFDAMDVGLVSFILAALKADWHLTPSQGGSLLLLEQYRPCLRSISAGRWPIRRAT